jgi:mxaJ protein
MSALPISATVLAILLLSTTAANDSAKDMLRVCADPNNLPYSNDRLGGFENRLAELVARDLGLDGVRYTWWAQRRGFLRNTLNVAACDVVMGLPTNTDAALTTRPYYQSSYAFVTRADRHLAPVSLDDPQLRHMRIGVQLVGDDGANSPPAHALSRRGIVRNVVGYSVYGDYTKDSPASPIVSAVASGDLDMAIVWGPLAGYFASVAAVPLVVKPVPNRDDPTSLPFSFAISMAVRRSDRALRNRLDRVIVNRRNQIDGLLARYHVPRVDAAPEVRP